MKTLVIVSHPYIGESTTQQFLFSSIAYRPEQITWHHLEKTYPTGQLDRAAEQQLLAEHERIIFQFPLYWYSSPPMLKQWLDEVLTSLPASFIKGKEMGLVVNTGVSKKEFCAGGREGYQLEEFLRPFQGIAKKLSCEFLKTFAIYQFDYMSEEEKQLLLIDYRRYLTAEANDSLAARSAWLVSQLKKMDLATNQPTDSRLLASICSQLVEQEQTIEDLALAVQSLKEEG